MRRALVAALAALAAPGAPAAAGAEEVYRWTSEVRSFSYAKSVCGRPGDGTVYTETVTQESFNRASGVSYVGRAQGLPRGSSISTGRTRYTYSKKTESADGVQHEDGTVAEPLSSFPLNFGAVRSAGKDGRTIDVTLVDEPVGFARLRKGQSITLRLDRPGLPVKEDDGRCATESRGEQSGTVTITRIR